MSSTLNQFLSWTSSSSNSGTFAFRVLVWQKSRVRVRSPGSFRLARLQDAQFFDSLASFILKKIVDPPLPAGVW